MKKYLVRKLFIVLVVSAVTAGAALWIALPRLNDYQISGELVLQGLDAAVEVVRDEKGMAYARAQSLGDVLFAQGFLTAQDRLFNMHLTRLMIQGRLTELVGERARDLDVRNRTLGFYRIAEGHTAILDARTRALFQRYVDGVNSFIETCPDDIHLEFRLAGLKPEPWSIEDSMALLYLMSWNSSANLQHEIVYAHLAAKVGDLRARTLDPLNINPDDPLHNVPTHAYPARTGDAPAEGPNPHQARSQEERGNTTHGNTTHGNTTHGNTAHDRVAVTRRSGNIDWLADPGLRALMDRGTHQIGSNNWVASPAITANAQPLLAGDPHLDPRMLPGVWYPMGLIWPDNRAVGVTIPGIPGMSIGRTEHIALSMTNSYGDAQDLYVETLDPTDETRYLEGEVSHSFETSHETLRILDNEAEGGVREETIEIRFTHRGPVVSGRIPGLDEKNLVTLRWATADPATWTSEIGFFSLLDDRDIEDVNASLNNLPMIGLNFVFADVDGSIGWRVSGRLPIRVPGAGERPWTVTDDTDPWIGWIPLSEMPQDLSRSKSWLGTANHLTVARDYPHYYTNRAASSYRYARLKQLFAEKASAQTPLTEQDFWQWQRDVKNPMAEALSPMLAQALRANNATRSLGDVLAQWDDQEAADQAGPLIFQEVVRQLALAAFTDELGEDGAALLLGNLYYWQERLQQMLIDGGADAESWWDDVTTPDIETRDDLIVRAGQAALDRLSPVHGEDPTTWRWGDSHYLRLYHPLRREGWGAEALGTQAMPMGGSAETLYRGWYDFNDPYATTFTASLRMVVDFADRDKIRAVLPGGVAGRAFHPHQQDQVKAFMSGEPLWWWFSDDALATKAQSRLHLKP